MEYTPITEADIKSVEDFSRVLSKAKDAMGDLKDELGTDAAKKYISDLDKMGERMKKATDYARKMQSAYETNEEKIKTARELISDTATSVADKAKYQEVLNKALSRRATLFNFAVRAEQNSEKITRNAMSKSRAGLLNIANAAGAAGKALDWRRAIMESLTKLPKIGGLFAMLKAAGQLTPALAFISLFGKFLGMLIAVARRFKQIEEAAKEFRVNTGITSDMMENIKQAAVKINISLFELGVTIKDVFNTVQSLYEEFQTTDLIDQSDIYNLTKWSANLGLATKDVAKIKALFTRIAESTGISVDDTILLGTALARAGGVAPSAVMKDIAEASEDALIFMAKSPLQMMKTAVEARRLGTSLKSIAESAKGFLNYQDSITAELEASALLGKSLSFQESRILAYNKDILGSREAALDVIERTMNFTSLDPYTMGAVARASKMTTEEIIKQLNQRKMLAKLESSSDVNDITRAKEYRRLLKNIGDQKKENLEIDIKKAREDADKQLRQNKIEQIINKATAAIDRLVTAWMPLIDMVLPTLEGVLDDLILEFDEVTEFFKDKNNLQPVADFINGTLVAIGGIVRPMIQTLRDLAQVATKMSEAWNKIRPTVLQFFGFEEALEGANEQMSLFQKGSQKTAELLNRLYETIYNLALPGATLIPRIDLLGRLLSRSRDTALLLGKAMRFLGFAQAASAILPLVGGLNEAAKTTAKIVPAITTAVSAVTTATTTAASSVSILSKIMAFFSRIGTALASFGGMITRFLPFLKFGKFIPGLGKIIVAIELIYRITSGLLDLFNSDEWANANFIEKIILGFTTVGKAIFRTIVGSFVDAFKAIGNWWFGKSPSKIALLILKGLTSTKRQIRDALTSPFDDAQKDIKTKQKAFLKETVEESGKSIGEWIKNSWQTILDRMQALWESITERVAEITRLEENNPNLKNSTSQVNKITPTTSAQPSNSTGNTRSESSTVEPADFTSNETGKLKNAVKELEETRAYARNNSPVINVNTDLSTLVAKMDDLIDTMSDRPVIVNMDGMRISRGLAGTA